MTVKTLFIGMDGATFTVLNDLTAATDGVPVMPCLLYTSPSPRD